MDFRIEPNPDPDVVLALERAEGWRRQGRETHRRFVAHPEGHFVARDGDGAILGVASCTAHGERLAWVSGMIVRSDARGRGVGRALLAAALAHADERKVSVVGLDATDLGRPMYEGAGFRPVAVTSRWSRPEGAPRPEAPPSPAAVYPISGPELMEVAAFDLERFGASRARWLAAVVADFPGRAFMAYDRATGALSGYALGQERFVGPLVADDPRVAARLLSACELAGTPPMAHLPGLNADAERVFREAGYAPEPGVTCTRMTRGGPLPGRHDAVYAIGSWQVG